MKEVFFLTVLFLAKYASTQVTNAAPHRSDLYAGEIYTFWNSDQTGITFGQELIDSLPFDVPQGISEEFSFYDIRPQDVSCNYPETQCFDHLSLDWNPQGHPDNGWFQPHFDFHFYMITFEVQASIVCSSFPPCPNDTVSAPLYRPVPQELMPPTYSLDPSAYVPNMGAHARDVNDTADIDPAYLPFVPGYKIWDYPTWIFGYFNATVIFYEPMIPLYVFNEKKNFEIPVPQPTIYAISAYFPKTLGLQYDNQTAQWSVILGGLRYVQAGQTPEEADKDPKLPPKQTPPVIQYSNALSDGIGSCIADEVYAQWIEEYKTIDHRQISYNSSGAENAIDAIFAKESDFGTLDSAIPDDDYLRAADIALFPIVAGSVVPYYNLNGVDRESGSLTMTRDVLARVFMRNITKWNDPLILNDNPQLANLLPNEEIKIVYRLDSSSGNTYVFTDALSKFNEDFATLYGPSDVWPQQLVAKDPEYYFGASGDEGVFATVRVQQNSIGYIGYPLLVNGFLAARYVRLINKSGVRVGADQIAVESATSRALFNYKFYASITDTVAQNGWPIVSFSYLVIRTQQPRSCERVAWALNFFATSMTRRTSREMTTRLGLSNIAIQIRNLVFGEWDKIQCDGKRIFDSTQFHLEPTPPQPSYVAPSDFTPFIPPNTPPFWDSQGSPIVNPNDRNYAPIYSLLYKSISANDGILLKSSLLLVCTSIFILMF